MTLTKADIAKEVYENHSFLNKPQATEAVETFLKITKDCLVDGEDVLLSGFGKFSVRQKKTRKGRNPQTGEEILLAARRVVTFKPSGILRDKINNR